MNEVRNKPNTVTGQEEWLNHSRTILGHPSTTLVALRHAKIKINTLLRWCSAGLMASYLLAIVTGIRCYRDYALISVWFTWLVPAMLILLFVCLLLVEFYYSEKKSENKYEGKNYPKPSLPMIKNLLKINGQITGFYAAAAAITWLLAAAIIFGKHEGIVFMLLTALILYGFGLFVMATLLKDKSATRRMIKDLELNG